MTELTQFNLQKRRNDTRVVVCVLDSDGALIFVNNFSGAMAEIDTGVVIGKSLQHEELFRSQNNTAWKAFGVHPVVDPYVGVLI